MGERPADLLCGGLLGMLVTGVLTAGVIGIATLPRGGAPALAVRTAATSGPIDGSGAPVRHFQPRPAPKAIKSRKTARIAEPRPAAKRAAAPRPAVVAPPATTPPPPVSAPAPVAPPTTTAPPTTAPPAPVATSSGPRNPATSTAPSATTQRACYTRAETTSSCDRAALSDINTARAREGLGALPLPADFYQLTPQAQLVAAANAERTSRGLPALPESSSLDARAQSAAQSGTNPAGPSNYAWASVWAAGNPTALAADFQWMYNDGAGSPNIDCTSSNTSGCWGHRDAILSPWSGASGAGVSGSGGDVQMTMLFVEDY